MSIQLTKIIADFDTQLAAPVSVGDTTATIVSVTDDDGNTIPNGTYGFTIDAGNSSKEYIICTLTSTALTAIYTATRQGVTTSGFARAHRRGAKVTITDWSAIKGIQNVLEVGYASATTPTTDYMLATKKYVDDASFAGATNASTTTPGVVELPVQSEVDAGTASGGAGPLVVTPDTLRARNFNDYVVATSGTDAYEIAPTPAITAYVAGQRFTFKADVANTGASTVAVSGLTAKTIKKEVLNDLTTGDILADQIVEVEYDGTNMQMVSTVPTPHNTYPVDIQTFTASDTWTKPTTGTPKFVYIQAWGGGGGGAKQNGGGGGGGAYTERWLPASSLGATETVTIGAGGSGTASNGVGGPGGNTTIGSLVTAYGGGGGTGTVGSGQGGGGGGALSAASTVNGGSPITATTAGLINTGFGGGNGGTGTGGDAVYGGAGGAGSSAGSGGSSLWGGAGGGNYQSKTAGTSKYGGNGGAGANGTSGIDGTVPGGGGGGTHTGTTSGAGASGKVIITTFF